MRPISLEQLDTIPADAIRLDVRTPGEYARGAMDGFINIPLDSLRERLGELDLQKPIYITCQIGLRGYLAQRILAQHGAANTWNLVGGYRMYAAQVADLRDTAAGFVDCTHCGMPK